MAIKRKIIHKWLMKMWTPWDEPWQEQNLTSPNWELLNLDGVLLGESPRMPSKCTHTTLQREQPEALRFPLYVGNQKRTDIFRFSQGCMVKSRRHRTSHRTQLSSRKGCVCLKKEVTVARVQSHTAWPPLPKSFIKLRRHGFRASPLPPVPSISWTERQS